MEHQPQAPNRHRPKTNKSSANSRGSKNSGGQMAETSQTMGVIAMNAVQKKLVRPDIPSCALATGFLPGLQAW